MKQKEQECLTDEQKDYVKKKIKKMDFFLVLFTAFMLVFTIIMLVMFMIKSSIPDTLCTCVFAICGIEYGACAWIKTNKQKYENILDKDVLNNINEENSLEFSDIDKNAVG